MGGGKFLISNVGAMAKAPGGPPPLAVFLICSSRSKRREFRSDLIDSSSLRSKRSTSALEMKSVLDGADSSAGSEQMVAGIPTTVRRVLGAGIEHVFM